MRKYRAYKYSVIPLFLFSISKPAFADMGVPMVLVTFPYMVIALIPIIFIEGYILLKKLKISKMRSLFCSAISNVVSTILGVPLTWVFLLCLQIITGGGQAYGLDTFLHKFLAVSWQAPWLIPYEDNLQWMIPIAVMVLLIPFFFVSWWIEYKITLRILRDSDHLEAIEINKAVFLGNLVSYLLLEFFALIFLIIRLI